MTENHSNNIDGERKVYYRNLLKERIEESFGYEEPLDQFIERIVPKILEIRHNIDVFAEKEIKARDLASTEFEQGNTTKALEAANLSVFFGKQKFVQQFILRKLGADPTDDPSFADRNREKIEDFFEVLTQIPSLVDPRFTLMEIAKNSGGDDSTYRNLLLGLYGNF